MHIPSTKFWLSLSAAVLTAGVVLECLVYVPAVAPMLPVYAGYWAASLALVASYATWRAYRADVLQTEERHRYAQQVSDLHLATIEALARAIDAKDRTAQMHLRRVQLFAARLATAAGLSKREIQGVKTAALLHDVGKLAVPEHILSKPGPLTDDEFQKVRIHPQVGADIIASVPFPFPVASIIVSHHERWDGRGYPRGLAGTAIPVGARILTIVDHFDAATSDRPYHQAVSHEKGIALLRQEAGHALDPALVPVFIDLLPNLLAEAQQLESRALGVLTATRHELLAPYADAVTDQVPASVGHALENIAMAHREMSALYEIAQTMGTSLGIVDTMTRISAKLSPIVPWSACTLFLYNPDTSTMTCRFAAGTDVGPLLNLKWRVGDARPTWPPDGGRAPVNDDPRVSFDAAGAHIQTDLQSAVICPLYVDDTFIGRLMLYHLEPHFYTDDHHRLLERIAEQAGAVIQNAIIFERTQEASLTDPLTGLPNRRLMFMHLSSEFARAIRLHSEVGVVLMDLDGFKGINDTYGHHIGDRALREMARVVRGALRPYDLCARHAGDEFVVVLTNCSEKDVEERRQELQRLVGRLEIEVRPGEHLRLGVSAGAAVFPHDGTTGEDLLARADERMYRDKAIRHSALDHPPARPREPRRTA